MSTAARFAFGALALLLLASTAVIFLPVQQTSAGLRFSTIPGTSRAVLSVTDPHGPAAVAGVRTGDIVDLNGLNVRDRLQMSLSLTSTSLRLPIERGHRRLAVTIRYPRSRGPMSRWAIATTVLMNVIYAALVVLLLRKPVEHREGRLLLYWIFGQLGNSIAYGAYVHSPVGFAVVQLLADLEAVAAYYFLARFVLFVPRRESPNTRALSRATNAIAIVTALCFTYASSAQAFPMLQQGAFAPTLLWGADIAFLLLIVGIIVDGLLHTRQEKRVQLQWIAGTVLFMTAVEIVRAAFQLLLAFGWSLQIPPWVNDPAVFAIENVAVLGAAYAVLRHRLIDMEFIVSRAAVFTAVSSALVLVFLVVEWVGSIVAERFLGALGHVALQYSSVSAALVAGLLARPVHANIERRFSRVFFRNQARNEEALRRFAREAEVATDGTQLLNSAFTILTKHVEGAYAAIAVHEGDAFHCVHATRPFGRTQLSENDPLALRLRRFAEPFELDDPDDELHHAVLFPMTVLGRLAAFVVCGPKVDRTRYGEREIETLTTFAQRVGTAYVLLREGTK